MKIFLASRLVPFVKKHGVLFLAELFVLPMTGLYCSMLIVAANESGRGIGVLSAVVLTAIFMGLACLLILLLTKTLDKKVRGASKRFLHVSTFIGVLYSTVLTASFLPASLLQIFPNFFLGTIFFTLIPLFLAGNFFNLTLFDLLDSPVINTSANFESLLFLYILAFSAMIFWWIVFEILFQAARWLRRTFKN